MDKEIRIFILDGKWTVEITFENGAKITTQRLKMEAIELYKKLKKL